MTGTSRNSLEKQHDLHLCKGWLAGEWVFKVEIQLENEKKRLVTIQGVHFPQDDFTPQVDYMFKTVRYQVERFLREGVGE